MLRRLIVSPSLSHIQGTFDDAQAIVKQSFQDKVFREKVGLAAVNSINWARVLAQITYYFYAYFQVTKKGKGDLLAKELREAFHRLSRHIETLEVAYIHASIYDTLTSCYLSHVLRFLLVQTRLPNESIFLFLLAILEML